MTTKNPSYLFKIAASSSIALLLMTTGCQTSQTTTPEIPTKPDVIPNALAQQATHIQQALASGNYNAIVDDIHPTLGVRFSMYAYVRQDKDKVFSREQFTQYLQQSKIRFTWGQLDGTGEMLVTPLPAYLQSWVGGSKFDNAKMSINEFKASGNSINNLKQVYPNAEFVEFYAKGSDKYAGLDWQALRLVFDEYQGKRYLVAIINDRSTV